MVSVVGRWCHQYVGASIRRRHLVTAVIALVCDRIRCMIADVSTSNLQTTQRGQPTEGQDTKNRTGHTRTPGHASRDKSKRRRACCQPRSVQETRSVLARDVRPLEERGYAYYSEQQFLEVNKSVTITAPVVFTLIFYIEEHG